MLLTTVCDACAWCYLPLFVMLVPDVTYHCLWCLCLMLLTTVCDAVPDVTYHCLWCLCLMLLTTVCDAYAWCYLPLFVMLVPDVTYHCLWCCAVTIVMCMMDCMINCFIHYAQFHYVLIGLWPVHVGLVCLRNLWVPATQGKVLYKSCCFGFCYVIVTVIIYHCSCVCAAVTPQFSQLQPQVRQPVADQHPQRHTWTHTR